MNRDENKYANAVHRGKGIYLAHYTPDNPLEVQEQFNERRSRLCSLTSLLAEREKAIIERERAVQALRNMYTMCDALLEDLKWEDADAGQLNREWLDLNALVLDVVARLCLHTANCSIHLQLANVLPLFLGDRHKLILMLAALLGKTIDTSSVYREIVISSVVEGHMVHISVRKSGEQGGSGRGCRDQFAMWDFALIDGIARMHGGLAWIEHISRSGSIFHLTLGFGDRSR